MDITDIIKSYGLPLEESSALESLLYGFRERRFKVSDIEQAASKRLTNSICCGRSGMQNFDARLQVVLKHFRKFNNEYPQWRNSGKRR